MITNIEFKNAVAKPTPTNHVFVCDVSGSMYNELPRIRQHLKNNLATLVKQDDTVSILYFSSRGQFGSVFVGERLALYPTWAKSMMLSIVICVRPDVLASLNLCNWRLKSLPICKRIMAIWTVWSSWLMVMITAGVLMISWKRVLLCRWRLTTLLSWNMVIM